MPDWQEADGDQLLDAQLIQSVQDGDTEAFGQLYERHARVVFRFIYSHLDNRLDAEDLTEEVFLRVWRSLPNYRDRGIPFVAYLIRISRSVLVDFYRRSKHANQALPLEDSIVKNGHPDPDEAAFTNIEHQELRQMLEQLREDYRTVLRLRFLVELSPEETALVMGRSAGAVRVLQHRALAALRKLFGSQKA